MFITAVCALFLIKLRWPRNKSLYETPPNLATFPKIYLATIWYDISWSKQFEVSMAIVF